VTECPGKKKKKSEKEKIFSRTINRLLRQKKGMLFHKGKKAIKKKVKKKKERKTKQNTGQ